MAANVNRGGVAAVFGDVVEHPSQRGAAVVHLLRILGPRSEAVADCHQQRRSRGEGWRHESHQVLVPDYPVASVHEQQHRGRLGELLVGHVDVQFLPLVHPVGQIEGPPGSGSGTSLDQRHGQLQVIAGPERRLWDSFSLFDHEAPPPCLGLSGCEPNIDESRLVVTL